MNVSICRIITLLLSLLFTLQVKGQEQLLAKDADKLDLSANQVSQHKNTFKFEGVFDQERHNFNYHSLFDKLYLLEDSSGELSIDEIIQSEYQAKFVLNNSDDNKNQDVLNLFPLPKTYQPEHIYWVQLHVDNPTTQNAVAWLMIGWNERSWNKIEIYRDDGTEIEKVGISGQQVPLEEKMAKDWRNFVEIEVEAEKQYTYYFRLDGLFYPKYADRINFYHFDEKAYWQDKSFALFSDGIFLGTTLLLILFAGVLYYFNRGLDTLFFGLQLIGIWLYDFADSENAGASNFFKELFPNALVTGDVLAVLGATMLIIGIAFFPIHFLQSKKFAPKLSQWIIGISYFEAVLYFALGSFNLFLYQYFKYPYDFIMLGINLFILIAILPSLLVLVLSFIALKQRRQLAIIFIIAYLPIILVILISLVRTFVTGIQTSEQFNIGLRMGHLMTYILFIVAIVYKRQLERKEIMEKRLELGKELFKEQQEAQRFKELDSFKSRLYTNLTHEFRTPLTVILGMAEHIRVAPNKYLTEGTQIIERNGKNLLRLINQLLDLSKIETQSFKLNLEQGDIIKYLRYLTESFRTYINSRNLSIQFSATLASQLMDYDAEQIKQIMTNLISNAIKFTPSGGNIQVRVAKVAQQLILKVEDTGVGISEKELTHVFDRFYQVDDSSTRKSEGTGIGLAHTHELVKLMGGTIAAESIEKQGTIFTITLPITQYAALQENTLSFPANTSTLISGEGEKNQSIASSMANKQNLPTLLIIEDNYDVVIYLKTCLEEQYQLDVAYNGAIGIEKALSTIPDLIISDVMMPEKDGYEVCNTLKNDERSSHIPIVLLTAKADTDSKLKGLSRGADVYLSKPFSKAELLVRLDGLVKQRQRLITYLQQKISAIPNKTMTINTTEAIEEAALIEKAFIKKVEDIIESNYSDKEFGLPQLCKLIGMSRSQLFRKMKALINQSPSQFIRSYRLKKAKYLLENTTLNVNEVTWEIGLSNPAHFSKIFKEEFGVSPKHKV